MFVWKPEIKTTSICNRYAFQFKNRTVQELLCRNLKNNPQPYSSELDKKVFFLGLSLSLRDLTYWQTVTIHGVIKSSLQEGGVSGKIHQPSCSSVAQTLTVFPTCPQDHFIHSDSLCCCSWRLLRVPWTVRRSNQSILKDISPEYSLEGLVLKLKLQYFGHLIWRTDSLEKTLMLGGEGDDRGWDGWMASLTQWTWVWVSSMSWWWTGKPGILQSMGSQTIGHDEWLNWTELLLVMCGLGPHPLVSIPLDLSINKISPSACSQQASFSEVLLAPWEIPRKILLAL